MNNLWKRLLSGFCLVLLLFCSANASNTDFVIENGILTEYHGPGGAVVIPDGVTQLQDTFRYNDTITSVILPKGLTEISSAAFERCKNLSSVTLPEGLLEIGALAFMDCEKLESIDIPDSVILYLNQGICDDPDFRYHICPQLKTVFKLFVRFIFHHVCFHLNSSAFHRYPLPSFFYIVIQNSRKIYCFLN